MSSVDLVSESPSTDRLETGSPRLRIDRGVLLWCLLSSLMLVGTGIIRQAQAQRYSQTRNLRVEAPFPLSTIPRVIDGWRVVDGSETMLDPLTTRITGSTDHMIRSYFDEMTGVTLSVLVLFGPAEPVLPHTPQVCYPASGFRQVGEPVDHTLKINDLVNVVARSSVFTKTGGRVPLSQAVYHTYRADGVWSPTVNERTLSHRDTGIFKVQIQRRVIEGERIGSDEPIESFLRKLIPVIETMTAASRARSNPPTPAGPVTPPALDPAIASRP